jgi:hypothetical protein
VRQVRLPAALGGGGRAAVSPLASGDDSVVARPTLRVFAALLLTVLVLSGTAAGDMTTEARAVPQGVVTLGAQASSPHFDVRSREEPIARRVLGYADQSWEELAPLFRPPTRTRTTIIVVEDTTEYEKIQPAPSTRGFATFGGSVIYLRGDEVDKEVVAHELTHILLGKVVRLGLELPDWFNEGLAQYASGSDEFTLELIYRMSAGELLSLPALSQVDALQGPSRELATLQGLAVIRFLVQEFGEQALWELVDNLRYARSFEQALLETYGHTDLELDKKWMAYAESHYSLLSPAMLRSLLTVSLGLLALLAALVWYVRRSRRLYGAGGPNLVEAEIRAAERPPVALPEGRPEATGEPRGALPPAEGPELPSHTGPEG